MVGGLLRQPAGGRQQPPELALEEGVDLEIGLADQAPRLLFPAFERMPAARPAAHRHLAGFAANCVEPVLIDHRGQLAR